MSEVRHILKSQQFTPDFMDEIFRRATWFRRQIEVPERRGNLPCFPGHILHNVAYEPSTRTRMSFTSAAEWLQMKVVSTENAKTFSSAVKGETLRDTLLVLSEYYPSVIVVRHHMTGELERVAPEIPVPIINAGDGSGQHPTQALLDVYTIQEQLGTLSNLTILIGGDLASGRTARSLTYLLAKYEGVKFIFVAPSGLGMGADITSHLDERGISYKEMNSLESALPEADVVYWTRIQTERKIQGVNYEDVARQFIITPQEMSLMKERSILMHPLPRVNEITQEVDKDPRAVYFRQAGNGMFIRMALLEWTLKGKS